MLACGEDLGMVPDCVPGVMDSQKILSLKMRGMEQEGEWKELSVCATSSHDMQTLRMQFDSDPEPWECRRTLSEFLLSPSMLAIFPIQDWLSLSARLRNPDCNERINCPENPGHHWRYRVHLDIHALAEDSDFCTDVASLIKDSGRN